MQQNNYFCLMIWRILMPTYSVVYYNGRFQSHIQGCSKIKSTNKNRCIHFKQFSTSISFFFTVIRSHNAIENMNDSINANIPQNIHVHVYVLHFKMYNVTFLCIVIFQQKVAKLILNPRLKKTHQDTLLFNLHHHHQRKETFVH